MVKKGQSTTRLQRSLSLHSTADGQVYFGVTLSIDIHYWRLYQEACSEDGDNIQRFEGALKTVVWGALYLEAMLNDQLVRSLKIIPKSLLDFLPIWDIVRPMNWGPKFELLARLANRRPKSIKNMRALFQQVMDLRNRIVHFKETPTAVDLGPLANKENKMSAVEVLAGMMPSTNLENELLGGELVRLKRHVPILRAWLGKTFHVIARLHGRKVRPQINLRDHTKPSSVH
jgi:hypothetical protein